jgi:hypothetical protein
MNIKEMPIFYENDKVTFDGETRDIESKLFGVRCKYRDLAIENLGYYYQGKKYRSKKELGEALEKMSIRYQHIVTIGNGSEVLKLNDVKTLVFKSILDTVKVVSDGKEFETFAEARKYVFDLPLEYKDGWCTFGDISAFDYQEQLSKVRAAWIKEKIGIEYKGKNFKDREELKEYLMNQDFSVYMNGDKIVCDREMAAESILRRLNV